MRKSEHPWEKYVIKDKDLVMSLGDRLRVVADLDTNNDEAGTLRHTKAAGQIYQAAGRKGAGWDLVKLSGDGPNPLRVLNGDILTYFEILPSQNTSPSPASP